MTKQECERALENTRLRTELAEIHKALDQTFPDWRRDGAEGTPLTPAEAILEDERISMRLYAEACKERDEKNAALLAENARMRDVIQTMLDSAHPHPKEHPTMTAAWRVGREALSASDHADWLERQRKLAAAEELDRWVGRYLESLSGEPIPLLPTFARNQIVKRAAELRREAGDIRRRTDGVASPRCPR